MPSDLQSTTYRAPNLTFPTKSYWLASLARSGYLSVLERLVAGSAGERLEDALEFVVRTVEAQDEGVIGSILLLDRETQQLRHAAGQRLPRRYRDAIDGQTVGPQKGSCGAAAYFGKRVVAADIATDPKWRDYRELALAAGLRASWSQPILDDTGVLGTFAMYYAQPREPSAEALLVIDAAAHLARLAIERDRIRVAAAERQKLEDRLWQGQKMESLGRLASGIAHDLGNLLVGVLGSADLVERKLPESSPALDDVRRIQSAGVRCGELCKQLLAYAGKGKFVLQTFHLPELIQEMGRVLELTLPKGTKLNYYLDDRVPPIDADSSQIRQVVMNLLTNAAESIAPPNGLISLSVDTIDASEAYLRGAFASATLPAGRYVTLEVADNGAGMDADTVNRIFDPFFTTKFAGRGLGLAAVSGIVRSHGGALDVYSEPGQGSRFKVLLPVSSKSAATLAKPRSQPAKYQGHGTVLLADDEEGVRMVAKSMLEIHGFDVLVAKDGLEALELFREHRAEIAIVLLDLVMPKMNGDVVLQELRRIDEKVPVILSSGYGEQDVSGRFGKDGFSSFVQKPFRYETFIEVFRRALEKKSVS